MFVKYMHILVIDVSLSFFNQLKPHETKKSSNYTINILPTHKN